MLDRRRFLGRCAAGLALSGLSSRVEALSDKSSVQIVRLKHLGRWDVHAGAEFTLARETGLRTSVDMSDAVPSYTIDQPEMRRLPFAVLAGDSDVQFGATGRRSLRRWLELGGTLWVDNAGSRDVSQRFDGAIRRELSDVFPDLQLERISPEHVIYRSFYRLDYAAGRVIRRPYMEGLKVDGRYAVIITHNDVMGAYLTEPGGRFQLTPKPGGENQREVAIRLGVNILMYALCLNYKDDQVHVDYLLRRRKWKIRGSE